MNTTEALINWAGKQSCMTLRQVAQHADAMQHVTRLMNLERSCLPIRERELVKQATFMFMYGAGAQHAVLSKLRVAESWVKFDLAEVEARDINVIKINVAQFDEIDGRRFMVDSVFAGTKQTD